LRKEISWKKIVINLYWEVKSNSFENHLLLRQQIWNKWIFRN
jgi:hypothetical protein